MYHIYRYYKTTNKFVILNNYIYFKETSNKNGVLKILPISIISDSHYVLHTL